MLVVNLLLTAPGKWTLLDVSQGLGKEESSHTDLSPAVARRNSSGALDGAILTVGNGARV